MTRRDAIVLVGRVAATVAGQAFLNQWLAAAHDNAMTPPAETRNWANYQPQFFSLAEFQALDEFTAVLLPTDETPGAREAHVAPFIDYVLSSAAEYAPEMQAEWRTCVAWLTAQPFIGRKPDEQTAWMRQVSQPDAVVFAHFQLIKNLAVYAFYTSRVGLIDNLEYKGLAYLTAFPGCSHPEHKDL